MSKKLTVAVLLCVLLCALLCACGKEEPAPEVDPVMQYTAVPERFLALLLTTNYQQRYETLIEATANATSTEDTLAAYDAYCSGYEELTTETLLAAMLDARDPYEYDEREFEQGRTLSVTGFDFEDMSTGENVVNRRFTVYVEVNSELGVQTGSISGEITVRTTDAGERIGGYFFYEDGWLADLSEPLTEDTEKK